ncbi:hypothetical protein DIS24_g4517 [Lasiodiplodia hormozganensis]|uniref:Uncharacterized protein n=1 Tax=Lasiodiplodia hormozganensis TaxID=869390 RepID=A0AA40D346_9PEZI|nr:hypothetical protein DIS24_g4517 [Lasiodiplodia hormozganensis]
MADSTNLVSSNVSHGEKLDSWAPFPELARASIVQMSQSGPDPGTWEATECLIEWCAKLYRNPTVTDGDVQPLSIDPIPFRTPPKGYNHSDLYGPGGHELPSFAITPAAADSLPSTLPPFDSNRFDVSVGDHEIIRSFVRRMLNFTFVNQDQLTVASAFAYGVDVAALMGNMTDSLTNLIRTGPNATVVEGVVLRPETFISVQWAWLALPIALVLLSAAFLVATLLVSRRHSVPLWKSGLLPYIFHNGLAGEWKEEERRAIYEGRVNKRPEMERRARGIGAKLTRSEEGETRLVRV